eukprot:363783-Chlamydomonas_euryale.AAC.10
MPLPSPQVQTAVHAAVLEQQPDQASGAGHRMAGQGLPSAALPWPITASPPFYSLKPAPFGVVKLSGQQTAPDMQLQHLNWCTAALLARTHAAIPV